MNVTWFGTVFANVIKLRGSHTGLGWALNLNPMWLVSLEEEGNLDTETHRGNARCWWRQRLQRCVYKPRIVDNHPKRARDKEGSSSRTFRKIMALPRPWFQTSKLQNCEIIHFCCFKLPSLWYFVIAALWNWYAPPTQLCSFFFSFPFYSSTNYSFFFLPNIGKEWQYCTLTI